ncbi:conserved exported hypothetical protein [Bradyrhizobium sp. STM 3843]|uniref:hypothetical protein n=1 Tax=Bradyrhizobium sp. STM 3843 TaxID=551947 RepID=UPI0002406C69|nr:hypothetical protein [Bradyrhizobium sp. STM 3843]CCE06267.1 conserved exported hypothetical protein [Bradyrhizobium sp. STM 3843]
MNKPVVIAAAALIAVASFSPTGAKAGDGGAIAAGVIGGLAVGALAGSAIANSRRAPAYVYDDDHVYVPAYRRRVRVYRYYEVPSYSGYEYPGYDYSTGYHDGYYDASSGW